MIPLPQAFCPRGSKHCGSF